MKRFGASIAGFALLLIAMLVALKIGSGSINITWSELFDWLCLREIDEVKGQVLGRIRLPRVLMAALAGSALACSGVAYQALLRNPLADPYTLGVSGGATLGAVAAIAFGERIAAWGALGTMPLTQTGALAGALGAMALVIVIARSSGSADYGSNLALILAGVTLNLVFSSLILLIEYFADFTQVYEMIRWMMGGLDVVGYRDFSIAVPLCLIGFAFVFRHVRDLDLLAVDPVSAASLGVQVAVARKRLLLAAAMMTGAVVALAGPIGFVGLIIPHAVRLVSGATHARVLPGSLFAGAIFLLSCDSLAQNLLPGTDLPVGVVTAVLGGPCFVIMLARHRGRYGF